ncbi:MAG: cell division protein FtsL [Gammaproteobacteria bacterium RBG_16_57_12]|nr:MAG: cell division protein FtsL [Gammaproteobacteria bacterium RBG_16_57_12]
MRAQVLGSVVLAVAVFGSALGVVYVKHQSRKLFVELEGLQAARDQMNVEWGQLQLEQSTLVTHGNIERIARTRLGMELPENNKVVIVGP